MFQRLSLYILVLLICGTAAPLQAQLQHSDSFSDGLADGWLEEDLNDPSFGPAIFDANSDAYTLAVSGEMPAGFTGSHGTLATWEPTVASPITDGFFRGTVRANTHGSTISLLSRADAVAGTDYGFFASTLYGTFGIEVFDASKPEPQTILGLMDPAEFPFAAGEDWIVEGGTVGDQITMKVWRSGEPEPDSPQLTFTDTTFQAGVLCLITYADVSLMTEPVMFSGTFDDLSFTAVPEPSTAALGLCALVLLAVRRRYVATIMTRLPWKLLVASLFLGATCWQDAHAQFLLGTPSPVGPDVNSSVRDNTPNLSSDGLTLYFSSRRSGGSGTQSLWQVTRETTLDPWNSPTNLTSIGGVYSTNPAISPDGLELYFADGWNIGVGSPRPGGLGRSDIWVSKRPTIHDAWGEPENLGSIINSSSADDGPFISPDGLSLYFASDRPGGHGGNDLYVASRQSIDAPWEPPVNLGSGVNASGNEWMGGLSPDQQTLFFDSHRPGSHSLGDMYLATRAGIDGPFADPVHFPAPVNASSGSWKMVMAPDESALYYTVGHGNTAPDVWEVPLMPFERVSIEGNGGMYTQYFDDALGVDSSITAQLPAGWTASYGEAVFHENATNKPFPSDHVGFNGVNLFNAGADQSSDRALAVYVPPRSHEPMVQLLAEVVDSAANAMQLTFDIEAWDSSRFGVAPGEAAFDVTVEIDRGVGFETLANLGTVSTGPVLTLPAGDRLDGNDDANRVAFDSGLVPASIPPGSELRVRWHANTDGATEGWIFGLDNVQMILSHDTSSGRLPGDYNNSGTVEQGDLDMVLLNWGLALMDPAAAGWLNDLPVGPIDQEELDKVLLGWGNSAALVQATGAAGVPEPGGMVLALLALTVTLISLGRSTHRR